jgi:hypothetical protein
MEQDEVQYTDGVGPEDMLARWLAELGWVMREQARAEAELDSSFAVALRARLVQGHGHEPVKRRPWRAHFGPLGLALALLAAGVALDRLHRRSPHRVGAPTSRPR